MALLEKWDHTARLNAAIYNLTCLVASFGGKVKPRPRSPSYFHPYREDQIQGMKVSSKNIGALKFIAYALSRK